LGIQVESQGEEKNNHNWQQCVTQPDGGGMEVELGSGIFSSSDSLPGSIVVRYALSIESNFGFAETLVQYL
jgi:hypothetical protein